MSLFIKRGWIVGTAGLLLVVAASRMLRLHTLSMNMDEVWSVWQTMGTPAQIIQWTPYDWPPLYYLTLGAWRGLTSPYPVILRYLSVLVFVVGVACLYRAARRSMGGHSAALLAGQIYAALGYAIWLSMEVRGYALLLGLLPLTLWLTLRYFDHPRWQRALPLALCLASMFYISLSSALAILALVIYTLIRYRRAVWRWWLPGLLAGLLALPEIVSKAQLVITRTEATRLQVKPPFLEAMVDIFHQYAGEPFLVWVALFLLALLLLVSYRRRLFGRQTLALTVWAVVLPILMYVLNPVIGFFNPRYSWWVLPGLALWLGWSLSRLPRIGIGLVSVLLFGLLWVPLPETYRFFEYTSELGVNFQWLKTQMVSGDVLVIDPGNGCGSAEEWDYYLHTYFPTGIQIVADPGDYRRIWYVLYSGQESSELHRAVADQRIPQVFVGSARCLFQLYEGPPDSEGILFENGLRFHGLAVIEADRPWFGPLVRREGEHIRLRLWWSVDRPLPQDYSIGVYVLRAGETLIAESNSPLRAVYPPEGSTATSQWPIGQLYVQEWELVLPYPLRNGSNYRLYLAVYDWRDNTRVSAPGVDAKRLLPLSSLTVKSY